MNNIARLKAKVAAGELCFGTHISNTEPDFYELCGLIGYDYVWIDNEHAGMTQPMIKNAIVATNAGGACAIVRVPDHETAHVKPVLECGPDGVIFPMVNSPAEAKQCVDSCLYPPRGKRGFGPLRAIDYGTMSWEEYIPAADDNTWRFMQCETKQAVECLDEIIRVDGVDAIICGPMDLSASVGKPGKFFDPEVRALMDRIIDTCRAAGMPFGLSIGMDMELIRYWVRRGANFLSMGTPLDYFREMSVDVIREVRALAEGNFAKGKVGSP